MSASNQGMCMCVQEGMSMNRAAGRCFRICSTHSALHVHCQVCQGGRGYSMCCASLQDGWTSWPAARGVGRASQPLERCSRLCAHSTCSLCCDVCMCPAASDVYTSGWPLQAAQACTAAVMLSCLGGSKLFRGVLLTCADLTNGLCVSADWAAVSCLLHLTDRICAFLWLRIACLPTGGRPCCGALRLLQLC